MPLASASKRVCQHRDHLPLRYACRAPALYLLALLGFSCGSAAATESVPYVLTPQALKTMSVEELFAQNVISVSRQPESWQDAASSIFLIRGQSVSSTGATSLPELLRLAPTLFVAQSTSAQWAINARGFVRSNAASNKLLVMIDGRSVYSPVFSNVFWESTTTFLPDLQQIEVISGPAGSTWGANAVNGVINIQTKSAQDTIGGLTYANGGTQKSDFGARYGFRVADRGAMRIYLQHSNNQESEAPPGYPAEADAWTSTSGGFRTDWIGAGGNSELTVSGDVLSARFGNGPAADTVADNANLVARWYREFLTGTELWVKFYHDYMRRDTAGDLTETTHTSDLEFQVSHAFGRQELMWGAGYRLISDRAENTNGFVFLPPLREFAVGSLFAQHQVGWLDDQLRVTSGLRLEHNAFSGWEYQPSVRLAWLRSRDTWWVAVSRATRTPSRLDSDFFAPENPPFFVVGGPNVKSETVWAQEIGWRGRPTETLAFTATVFYNNYDHLRSVEPPLPITIANGLEGKSYGSEFFADWDVTAWWRMRFGGFRTNQSTWYAPGGADLEGGRGESSFPKYQAQWRNTFRPGKTVTIWTALRHVADVMTYESGVTGLVPAYTELDASFTWAMRSNVDLSFTGRNLLQPAHPEISALVATRYEHRRSLQARLEVRF